jgi:hypothetical protein
MTIDEIKQQRDLEIAVRTWYYERTGKYIKSRACLTRVTKDYTLAKAVEAVLGNEDAEIG